MLHNFGPKTSCEEEARFMQERVQDTEKKLTTLCEVFNQYAVATARIRDKADKLGKTTLNFAENEKINLSLAEQLRKFGESMHTLGDYGDLQAKSIESNVTHEFSKYGEFCKIMRKEIVTIFDVKDKEYQRKRHFERMKERGNISRQQMVQTEQELVKASADLTKTVRNVEEKMQQFEKEKIHDLKSILLDFIATEIGYHAKSLEILSQAFKDVGSIDEKSDLEEFKKSLKNASIVPEPTPRCETRNQFFRPSQSLGSIAAIFSHSHRKREQGIPHSKTMDSKRGIDSGSSETSEEPQSQVSEGENTDYYLHSVKNLSSDEESVDNSPIVVRKGKNNTKLV